MNNIKTIIILVSLILSYSMANAGESAGGFEGHKKSEVKTENWLCEYCPEFEKWDVQIFSHLGFSDDTPYRYGNYSGTEKELELTFSGDVNMQDGQGRYWKTSFQNLGLDSAGIQSAYGKQESYALEFDFQSIPVRKFDRLVTPFENPGSAVLRLPNAWNPSGNGRDFSTNELFNQFELGSDWDLFKLSLAFEDVNNFDFSTSYRRLEKEGVREFSATQILNSTFLPFPVDEVIEDFNVIINYAQERWHASLKATFSKFDNEIDAVTYANPYISLVPGSAVSSLSTAPDNTSTTLSFNGFYRYAQNSFAKIRYSVGVLTQDEAFLPFTTNPNLSSLLPQADLDGEVETENLTLQLNHWINAQWTVRAKYRYRERDNKSDQLLFQPVVTDVFIATSLINLPYDFSKESAQIQLDYRPTSNHLFNLGFKSDEKTRNFQSVYETTNDGYFAKYRATLSENLSLVVNGEQLSRDSSTPELIDFLGVEENPLMRRFNVADREQDKINLQVFYTPTHNVQIAVSGFYSEQDYDKTQVGLTNNRQGNLNFDLNWNATEITDVAVFMQKEKIKTLLSGSSNFSTPDWFTENIDEVDSFGISFVFKKLADEKLNVHFSLNRSDADSDITVIQNGLGDELPTVASLWTTAELDFDYQYSKRLTFGLHYQYQEFKSQDFAVDNVLPGDVTNLLTFGAFSNNYDVNYLALSAGYKF